VTFRWKRDQTTYIYDQYRNLRLFGIWMVQHDPNTNRQRTACGHSSTWEASELARTNPVSVCGYPDTADIAGDYAKRN
jgi:hypothetical protein